mgnify:CR=1 FL=1
MALFLIILLVVDVIAFYAVGQTDFFNSDQGGWVAVAMGLLAAGCIIGLFKSGEKKVDQLLTRKR